MNEILQQKLYDAGKELECCRFSAAVMAYETYGFSLFHFKGNIKDDYGFCKMDFVVVHGTKSNAQEADTLRFPMVVSRETLPVLLGPVFLFNKQIVSRETSKHTAIM